VAGEVEEAGELPAQESATAIPELVRDGERYRALIRATTQMFWTAKPDGNVDDLLEWRAFTGQTREEVSGSGWVDALHPDDREATLEAWRRAHRSGHLYSAEYRVRGSNGRYRWFAARAVPVFEPDGRVREWVGTWTDVTDRRLEVERREREHAELERRFAVRSAELTQARQWAEALAGLGDALQSASGIADFAQAAAEHLGPALRADHIISLRAHGERLLADAFWGNVPSSVRELLSPPGAGPEEAPVLWGTMQEGEALYSSEYRAIPGSQNLEDLPPLSVGYEPVKDREGRVIALFGIARSPGEGPWMPGERDLMRRAAASIRLAHERTENTNRISAQAQRLAEQNRELEARNAEQETFVYTVSHDLRQPLLSIEGMSNLLREAVRSGGVGESEYLAERITRNVARMGELLNDLLALSRIGRSEEEASDLSLGAVFAEAAAQLEGRLAARGVALELPAEWPVVHFERTELAQVVANLLTNAIKWAGAAGAAPFVRVAWVQEGDAVTLAVHDNGPGIDPRHRERVFGLFQKLDSKAEGTGVGLAIVKRVVERHGGRAWVEDSPLGGAAFLLTLPSGQGEGQPAA
jgi:PAS domain S-box-containing protein